MINTRTEFIVAKIWMTNKGALCLISWREFGKKENGRRQIWIDFDVFSNLDEEI